MKNIKPSYPALRSVCRGRLFSITEKREIILVVYILRVWSHSATKWCCIIRLNWLFFYPTKDPKLFCSFAHIKDKLLPSPRAEAHEIFPRAGDRLGTNSWCVSGGKCILTLMTPTINDCVQSRSCLKTYFELQTSLLNETSGLFFLFFWCLCFMSCVLHHLLHWKVLDDLKVSGHLHRVDPNNPIIDFRFLFKISRALFAFHEIHHHSGNTFKNSGERAELQRPRDTVHLFPAPLGNTWDCQCACLNVSSIEMGFFF